LQAKGGGNNQYGGIDEVDEIWWKKKPVLPNSRFGSSFFQGRKIY
jgi:hypothetical protein